MLTQPLPSLVSETQVFFGLVGLPLIRQSKYSIMAAVFAFRREILGICIMMMSPPPRNAFRVRGDSGILTLLIAESLMNGVSVFSPFSLNRRIFHCPSHSKCLSSSKLMSMRKMPPVCLEIAP